MATQQRRRRLVNVVNFVIIGLQRVGLTFGPMQLLTVAGRRTGRLRTFLELGDENAVQLGMSVASGETTEKQRDTLLGWEGRYKYRPEGWLHPLVTVTGAGRQHRGPRPRRRPRHRQRHPRRRPRRGK